MSSFLLWAAVQAAGPSSPLPTDDHLTVHDVWAGIPTDPLSLATIVLLVVGVGAVLHFGRDRSGGGSLPGGGTRA